MSATARAVLQAFQEGGFYLTYQSAAVFLLSHPDYPGLEVRIGTLYVVIDRGGGEIYRAPLRAFDMREALERIHPDE